MTEDKPEKQTDKRRTTTTWAVQGYLIRFPNRLFTPAADIIELDDRIVVLVEIAGMQSDAFKIALHNQELVVSGRRERPLDEASAYHQAEIGFGDFRLSVPMPWTIVEDAVTANYRSGFLRIDLPRQQSRRVHIVDVNTDSDENQNQQDQ